MQRSPRSLLARIAVLVAALTLVSCAHHGKPCPRPNGSIAIPKESIIYDDGDTITFDEITIRVLGIDTPEIAHPAHGFAKDQPYGPEAAARAKELMRDAECVSYLPYQNDRYGRLLAHLFIDGKLLGLTLIREGLAYETVSHYGDNGFPELADQLLRAAKEAGEPPFEPPYIWRQEHRKERAGE